MRSREGQRKVSVANLTKDGFGEGSAEDGAWSNAATIVSGEAHDIRRKALKPRQRVVRHTDLPIPLVLELDRA